MASPQRRDPEQLRQGPREVPPPALENLPEVEHQIGTGGAFNWAWVWIPVAIAAFWFVGWGWGPYGGWWWGQGVTSAQESAQSTTPGPVRTVPQPGALAGGAPGNPALQPIGPGVAILNATNRRSYIGKPFQVENVPVQKSAGQSAVWIGTGTPMLLVLPRGPKWNIANGTRFDVSGTVRKAPPAAQARQQWSLSSADAAQLERQGVYIQSNSVAQAHP